MHKNHAFLKQSNTAVKDSAEDSGQRLWPKALAEESGGRLWEKSLVEDSG